MGKPLRREKGEIPGKKNQLGINDFEQKEGIRLTIPVNEEEDQESVITIAHGNTPTPASYDLEIGRIRLFKDSLTERTEGGVIILNGNKQMIAGSGTAGAIFSREVPRPFFSSRYLGPYP